MVITRDQILANSYLWPESSVWYSMDSYDSPTGHRTDCSGYVSMCLGLPTPGLSTVTLADVCHLIDVGQLEPGDIIGNLGPGTAGAAGHVQLFTGWDGDWLGISEQSGGRYGPWRHSIQEMAWGYSAWRFNDVGTEPEPEPEPVEEDDDMNKAWIAQDAQSIVLVWLSEKDGPLFCNIGAGEAVGGWNAAGLPGPYMVPNIHAIAREYSTVGAKSEDHGHSH